MTEDGFMPTMEFYVLRQGGFAARPIIEIYQLWTRYRADPKADPNDPAHPNIEEREWRAVPDGPI